MKNEDEKVSIIVPIYNAEKYLRKCINSILYQSYSNLEIILVNDGSKDKSEKIVNDYDDNRIKYYKKPNEGIGKTRNFGLNKATGKYIMFLDSDDYIDLECCKTLVEKMKEDQSDLVVSDYYKDKNGKIEYFKIDSFEPSSLKENPNLLLSINLGPCNKLFKRKIIIDNKIKFNEKLKYEDTPFVCEYLLKAKKISKLDEALSYYCIHGNSETTVRDERIFDIIEIVKIVREELGQYDYLKDNLDILTVNILTNYTIQQRYQKDKKIRNKFIEECFKYIQENISDYKDKKYYNGKGLLRRKIESSEKLTKMYCSITSKKYG